MMYDPKTQLQMVSQRHEDLRAVAGRGRLFARRSRVTADVAATAAGPAPHPVGPVPVGPVAPMPDQQVPALPLRLA